MYVYANKYYFRSLVELRQFFQDKFLVDFLWVKLCANGNYNDELANYVDALFKSGKMEYTQNFLLLKKFPEQRNHIDDYLREWMNEWPDIVYLMPYYGEKAL